MAMNAAVFLDKDGTLVHDVPYNVNPERLRLRSDAGEALARLQDAGYALIVVSNQPGIALGMYEEAQLNAIWERLACELAPFDVRIDAFYHCPHHPHGLHPLYSYQCDCRKPRPALIMRAAYEHDLDLRRSWMIGDILDDVEAGRRAGCRTILLDVGSETQWRRGLHRKPHFTADSLSEAAGLVLGQPPVRTPGGAHAWTR